MTFPQGCQQNIKLVINFQRGLPTTMIRITLCVKKWIIPDYLIQVQMS